jgi:hypothetical protein
MTTYLSIIKNIIKNASISMTTGVHILISWGEIYRSVAMNSSAPVDQQGEAEAAAGFGLFIDGGEVGGSFEYFRP